MEQSDLFAALPERELAPVYTELLTTARRMVKHAEAKNWVSLLQLEADFFKVFERAARHEEQYSADEGVQRRRDVIHEKVREHVARTRALLSARQRELASQLQQDRGWRSRLGQRGMAGADYAVEACPTLQ